jgi:hypothetical protein
MKRRFLVALDYDKGGIWASVLASSADEIRQRYPALHLVDSPPKWMDKNKLAKLEDRMTIDIDDEDNPFFQQALSKEE